MRYVLLKTFSVEICHYWQIAYLQHFYAINGTKSLQQIRWETDNDCKSGENAVEFIVRLAMTANPIVNKSTPQWSIGLNNWSAVYADDEISNDSRERYIFFVFVRVSLNTMFATIATIRDKKLSGRRQAARLCLSSYSFDSTTRSVAAGFGRHGMPPPPTGR